MSSAISIDGFESDGFQVVCDFANYENFPELPSESMERLHRILIQTQGGQMARPRVMFKMIESALDHEPTEEEVHEAYVLGWVIELAQFGILTSDDIVDNDDWRRGRWSWHKQPGVGQGAVFDSFVGVFLGLAFLRKHLGKHKAYLNLVEVINQEMLRVQLGQSCEHMLANQGPGNASKFYPRKLRDVSIGTSGYFRLPLCLALHYLGLASAENIQAACSITDELAVYYQAQNDFLNLYGSRAKNGKSGRDISSNKCSWLIVEALQRSNDEQRAILLARYGQKDEESVAEVKKVFEDLNMVEAFQSYKAKKVSEIEEQIKSLDESSGLKRHVFQYYLEILILV